MSDNSPAPRTGKRGAPRRGLTPGHIYAIIICVTVLIIVAMAAFMGDTTACST